jgi:signal transduction histidine kinase
MRKFIATIILLLSVTSVVAENSHHPESKERYDHLCDLYNNDKNDSLIYQAKLDLEYDRKVGSWDNYYETWMLLVNTYVFMGHVNMGLKEVQVMHQDAIDRNDKYGMALANYAMGNAYINMGHLDEAIGCYKQSLELIDHTTVKDPVVNDIFSYYCDALNEKKDYQTMTEITSRWKTYIDRVSQDTITRERSANIWYSYYYLACAQQNIGLGRLDEAKNDIEQAEKRKIAGTTFVQMSILYYWAQLYLRQGNYEKALEYNTQRLKQSKSYDDKSSTVLIYQQRGEIMEGLGRFEEAAQMFKAVHELTDSIYKKDVRSQITELSTLFRVNELDMEKRLERNRFVAMTAIIICIALALLVGYWYWMNRRLKKKNEELAIARDKAQESSRMKTDFIKNITHEIRTPLNILSGFAQILSQPGIELSPDITQEASMEIQQNTNRITSLINRLLSLSESSSRSVLERTDTINVNQLCLNAISQSRVGDSMRWTFNFESSIADDLTILTAEQYAVSALCHLLDNAMKFTPDGGTITLRCQTADNQLVIGIEDTGCGIPAEKADEIFAEFVQLDEYKEGVGIGLTVSRNIARRLGGDITLDTSYTNGARFLFTLPL